MTLDSGGGWRVEGVCVEHNHELNDRLDDRGLPPRAKTIPVKGARAKDLAIVRSFTPPGEPPSPMGSPSSACSSATTSGIKRMVVPMQERLLLASRTQFPLDTPAFLMYNDKFNDILGAHADLVLVLREHVPFAYEAGVYFPKGDCLYVTSNQLDRTTARGKRVIMSKITRSGGNWTRAQVSQDVRMPCGGVVYSDFILDGVLFCSQGDLESPAGLVQMECDYPFRTRTMLNHYHGRQFNSPKGAAIHSDGSIWFTDPTYGHDQGLRPPPELPNQVYRFDPHTGDVRVMADGFGRPSGICFSPFERICYISDTDSIHGDGNVDLTRASTIYAYDIEARRQSRFLTNRRVFAMANAGVPEGLKCDTVGNVYAACGDGLSVWSAGGVLLGKVLIPNGLANFCFGKKGELFLLNGKKLWVLKVADTVKGATFDRDSSKMDERANVE